MTDLAMDYLGLDALLSAGEIAWRDTVRAFVRDRIRPNIKEWYEKAIFPAEIVPEMGRLGLLGTYLSGYGCPGRSAVEYGLAALELEAGDSGLRTFVSVQGSLAMRASIQCDITLTDVRVPADAILPGAEGLRGPFSCLNEARYGIIWGAMGAARDAYEAALAYALDRRQFGKPIAAFQLTQEKLVDMVLEIQKGLLVALHIGRMKDSGTLVPEQISFGKLNNVRTAIAIARQARTILGGNGVALEYSPMRHASNLEGVRTYEGTDEIHILIMGRAITGIAAFG